MATRIHRNAIVLVIAAGFGLGAAWLSSRYLEERIADIEHRSRQETTEAVVAKETLAAGTPISPEDFAVRQIPTEWLHSDAIMPEQFDRAIGAALTSATRGGEPLLWSRLESRGSGRFSSSLLPGRRAATVAVDEINSLSGMLAPGDVIDLLVTVSQDRRTRTLPLLQSARVLAIGARTHAAQESGAERERAFTTITLDLSPEQATQLVAARSIGRLTALLRAQGDRAPIPSAHADAFALLGLEESTPQRRRPIPVIYGGAGNPFLEAAPLSPETASAHYAATAMQHTGEIGPTTAPAGRAVANQTLKTPPLQEPAPR